MSDETEWMLINLDETMAQRQGLPAQIPVPKGEFEGLADKGLSIEGARKWVKRFLDESEAGKSGEWRKQNSRLLSTWDAFLDKAPLWDRAQKAFAENDFDKAAKTLKRIVVMDDGDHAAKMNLAAAYANVGEHDKALKQFKQIRKSFEGDPDYHVSFGHLHMAMQKRDEAVEEFVNALEAQPDNQVALDALAKLGVLSPIYENPRDATSLTYVRSDSVLEYLTGQWDEGEHDAAFFLEQLSYHERESRHTVALAAAERALKKNPEGKLLERATLGRIAALRALGRHDEALEHARKARAELAKSAGPCVELARCLKACGKNEDAREEIERALEIDPGDQAALVLRFWPEDTSDLHTVNATIPELSKFAESHADAAGVWRSLGRALLIVGRSDEALEHFKRAVELDGKDDELRAEWWTELGKVRRFEEIRKDAETISDMKDRDWKLRWNEAEAYAGLGRRMEARALFMAINADDRLHVDVRKRAKRAVLSIDEGDQAAEAATPG